LSVFYACNTTRKITETRLTLPVISEFCLLEIVDFSGDEH
jgi:hypothetical protein